MKNLKTFKDFVNENKIDEAKKFKNINLGGDLSEDEFGMPINSEKDLVVGKEYIIHDPGMNEWMGSWGFTGHTGGKYIFNSTYQFDEDRTIDFSLSELKEYIKDELIYTQI